MGRIYEEVTATRKDIGTLDNKVEQALKQTADHEARVRTLETQAAQSTDHESRIKALEDTMAPIADHRTRLPAVERKVWMATGVTAFLAAGAAAGATLLTSGR